MPGTVYWYKIQGASRTARDTLAHKEQCNGMTDIVVVVYSRWSKSNILGANRRLANKCQEVQHAPEKTTPHAMTLYVQTSFDM